MFCNARRVSPEGQSNRWFSVLGCRASGWEFSPPQAPGDPRGPFRRCRSKIITNVPCPPSSPRHLNLTYRQVNSPSRKQRWEIPPSPSSQRGISTSSSERPCLKGGGEGASTYPFGPRNQRRFSSASPPLQWQQAASWALSSLPGCLSLCWSSSPS